MDGFANNFTLIAHRYALRVKPVDYSMEASLQLLETVWQTVSLRLSTIIQVSTYFFRFLVQKYRIYP